MKFISFERRKKQTAAAAAICYENGKFLVDSRA